MNKLSDYLYIFKNVVSTKLCDEIVRFHKECSDWKEHSYDHYDVTGIKNKKELLNVLMGIELTKEYSFIISKCLASYCDRYTIATNLPPPIPKDFSHPRLNRYVEGSGMSIHFDNITSLFQTKTGSPILTILGGLNSMNEYTGGELYMFNDLQIPLDKGDILIFPSAFMYPHRVEKVKSGERWSVVSWTV